MPVTMVYRRKGNVYSSLLHERKSTFNQSHQTSKVLKEISYHTKG